MKVLKMRILKVYLHAMQQLFLRMSQVLCTSSITTQKKLFWVFHRIVSLPLEKQEREF